MTPSSATTQRGARVGTSSASLILPQAAGFGRCAAPPFSSANAALVCLGAAPTGPFFTDSRWINPVRRGKRLAGLVGLGENPKRGPQPPHWSLRGVGRIQRGGRSPLIGRCGGWSLGGGHSRKCPPPMRVFGHFLSVQKVTRVWAGEAQALRGTGPEAPKSLRYGGWTLHIRAMHTAREKIFPFRLLTNGLTSDMVSYTSNEPLNQQRRDLVE